MAFDCSWLAFQATPKPEVLALAGLRDTGRAPEDPVDGPAFCAEVPAGWTILYIPDSTWTLYRAAPLSANRAVLSVIVQEFVPLSIASFLVRAETVWTVEHDGNQGPLHLDATGRVPPEFAPIRDRLTAQQKHRQPSPGGMNVDYLYDAPLDLAAAICGFRHDLGWFGTGGPAFTVAEPA